MRKGFYRVFLNPKNVQLSDFLKFLGYGMKCLMVRY